MKTIQEMAQKATGATGTLLTCSLVGIKEISYFAALVREDAIAEANAKANASWTLMCEKMVAIEREACAKVADSGRDHREASDPDVYLPGARKASLLTAYSIAAAIRARGQA